ncbi:anthranilate synthase [Artemisia annua]|uniref:Anthranilate synthase n=1 Tax=Artemisia annua TaxID=35608 RepID=A0A2U1NSH6_ARTAN|nr:anthranilate synthase [Artemisia annua]
MDIRHEITLSRGDSLPQSSSFPVANHNQPRNDYYVLIDAFRDYDKLIDLLACWKGDGVIVFDNVEKKAYVIHWVRMDQYSSVEEAFKDGTVRLETLASRVHDIVPPKLSPGSIKLYTNAFVHL